LENNWNFAGFELTLWAAVGKKSPAMSSANILSL
jgi:hypothetical protein